MGPELATLFDSLGWAILHSVWQGTVAAIAVIVFRSFTKDSQAALRYGFQTLALLMCLVAFAVTFGIYQVQSTPSAIGASNSLLSFTNISAVFTPAVATSDVFLGSAPSFGAYVAPYTPFLGGLWVLGFTLLALKYSTAFVLTQRLRRYGLSSVSADWNRRFSTLVLNAGIRRNVQIFVSNKIKGPLTLGFFKPIVLVPTGFFASLPADQIEAILLHEIGHIRRHDYLVNLLQTAIRTIFFFHPAVHYISRKIDHDREHACDDFAVACNRDPDALIRGLAALRMKLSPEQFALAADNGNTPLVARLKRLGAPTETRRRPEQVMTSMLALLVATGFYVASSPLADAQSLKVNEDLEPDLALNLPPQPVSHPSAKKHNYKFKQISKDGRTFTVKVAEDGTRWINVKGSWYDIDRSPQMVADLPLIPIAPSAPVLKASLELAPDVITNVNQNKLDQYNVNLDYYVASATHADEMAGGPKTDRRSLERNIEAAEKAREDALERAERIREEAQERAEEEIERQIERAEADYERAMAQAEQQRERAEEQRERAMEQAEAHRERAMAQAEREQEQAERQAQMAERQREMMEAQLERAGEERDSARERAEDRAEQQRERAMERAERQREREEQRRERLDKHAQNYKAFSDAIMVQLKSDGLIASNADQVKITYPGKTMFVNGTKVDRNIEDNYCELLDEYGIKKTSRTKITIGPEMFEYSSHSNDGKSRHRVQETLDKHATFKTPERPPSPTISKANITKISFTEPTQLAWVSPPDLNIEMHINETVNKIVNENVNRNININLNKIKNKHKHKSADLAVNHNTSVVDSAPGLVTSAQLEGRWGNRVMISQGGAYRTRHADAEKVCKEEADTTALKQQLGTISSNGDIEVPYLHFEVRHNPQTSNPDDLISGLGKT